LTGQPFLLWNIRSTYKYRIYPIFLLETLACTISGKTLVPIIATKFSYQIVEIPWKCLDSISQAPLLDFLLSICQSIRSWLELRHDHVAVLYFGGSGSKRAGLISASVLKYLGVYKSCGDAFEYFYMKRSNRYHYIFPNLKFSF